MIARPGDKERYNYRFHAPFLYLEICGPGPSKLLHEIKQGKYDCMAEYALYPKNPQAEG